jgi:hypothetical protein
MGRFRALLALKLAAELGGAALAALAHNGCAGATLVMAGHLAFNALNDQYAASTVPCTPSARTAASRSWPSARR